MPRDDTLPPSRLPPFATAEHIVRHFSEECGVRVDVNDLDALPSRMRLRLSGVRLPEPPEAALLDRVLQVVPSAVFKLVIRMLIVDAGITAHLGVYGRGVIRLGTGALRLRLPDEQFADQLSILTGTLLHEFGHTVFQDLLTPAQRRAAEALYLDYLIGPGRHSASDLTPGEAEHHFVALFVAALARISYGGIGPGTIRDQLQELGVPLE
jgi:hypothetical protein